MRTLLVSRFLSTTSACLHLDLLPSLLFTRRFIYSHCTLIITSSHKGYACWICLRCWKSEWASAHPLGYRCEWVNDLFDATKARDLVVVVVTLCTRTTSVGNPCFITCTHKYMCNDSFAFLAIIQLQPVHFTLYLWKYLVVGALVVIL